MTRRQVRTGVEMVGVAVAYLVTARLGLLMHPVAGFATLVWPPTGIALAALIVLGKRVWPGIAVGALAANLLVGAPVFVAIGIAAGNTLEAVLGAYAIGRIRGFHPSLERLRDVVALLLLGAVASTVVSATIGVTSLYLGGIVGSQDLVATWRAWWIGDAISDVIVAPLILVWTTKRRTAPGIGYGRFLEALALAVWIGGVGVLLGSQFGSLYTVFPALIWVSVRFSQREVVIATFTISAIAVVFTILGYGRFAQPMLAEDLLGLQSFLAIVTPTFLVLGAVVSERRRSLRELEARRLELEDEVNRRTEALTDVNTLLSAAHGDLERRVRDRTEEVTRTAEALHESDARKSSILEASLDCIISIDVHGKILEFNPAAERTFGHRRVDALGQEMASLLIPERLRQAHRDGLARFLTTQKPAVIGRRVEMPAVRADGTEFLAEITIVAIHTAGGPEFTGFLRDITDKHLVSLENARLLEAERTAHAQAEDAVRARDAFLSIAAHELRNPIGVLRLSSAALEDATKAEPVGSRIVVTSERMTRQVHRLTRLVDSLLDVSRITAGRLELELEEVDLCAVVRTAVASQLVGSDQRVEIIANGPVIGRWDRMRLEQVAINLLSNAVKYGGNKQIEIRVEGDDQRGRLIVRDHGIGIAPEDQAKIFEQFERVGTPHRVVGFGLGLWIVHQIVEALGGTVSVASALGEGTTFTVELVRGMPATAAPPPEVLVVEDDQDALDIITDLLRSRGYAVAGAHNGKEALDYLGQAHPSVILLDLTMPVMDGAEFLYEKERAASLAPIPVILVSADHQLERKAEQLGVAGYLPKPIDLHRLVATIERHCRHASA